MQRPECQYFRKERYPTNEDETHFEIIPWCDCNGRPDHTDHAAVRDALVQALEDIVTNAKETGDPAFEGATDIYCVPMDDIDKARAALALAKE